MGSAFRTGVLVLAASLPQAIAVGGTIRTDRSDALYTALAAQPEFASVGRFDWTESGSSFLGSGTLIRDDWVLTAAHVIDGTDGFGGGISNLRFQAGGVTRQAAEWVPFSGWSNALNDPRFPGTTENDILFAGLDIGLVRLSAPIDNVDPAELFTGRDELAQQATIVGFGATGTGATGATQPAGTRRAGQNIIDAVGQNTTPGSVIAPPTDRLLTIDFDNPNNPADSTLGSSQPLDLEYLTAPGDSGGGLFLDTPDGVRLAGVTSLGSSFNGANSDYGDRASFTRVSSFLDFIEETIGPEPLAGDLNGDNFVSAADFAVARDLGLPLDDFFEQFGLTDPGAVAALSPVVAVPEPAGLLLLLGAFFLPSFGGARRR